MARPEKPRRIGRFHGGGAFQPVGVRPADLATETIRADELEALRLADVEGLYQEAAAERMGVSRTTFSRILARARTAVARSVIEGRMLVVDEGPVVAGPEEVVACPVPDWAFC